MGAGAAVARPRADAGDARARRTEGAVEVVAGGSIRRSLAERGSASASAHAMSRSFLVGAALSSPDDRATCRRRGGRRRPTTRRAKKHSPTRRIVSGVISLLIVGGIFFFAIPKVADYSAVWKAFESLTGLELLSLFAATVFNLFTYWWANMAALPGPEAEPGGGAHADDDLGREHVAGRRGDRRRPHVHDLEVVGVHGHRRRAVRRRDRHLEHLRQARAAGDLARLPRDRRREWICLRGRGRRRRDRAGDRGRACSRRSS